MKRSEPLTPLSWEHHSALVNANRIKRGIAVQADPIVIQEFLEYIWKTDLQGHFKREEDNFTTHPAWNDIADHLRRTMLNEHVELEDLVEKTINTSDRTVKTELMDKIADIIIAHVRFEERQLYPAIEEAFDSDTLQKIGKALKEQHVPGCIHWQPPFWEKPSNT